MLSSAEPDGGGASTAIRSGFSVVFGVMEQVIQFFRREDLARGKDYLAPPTCRLGFYRWCAGVDQ